MSLYAIRYRAVSAARTPRPTRKTWNGASPSLGRGASASMLCSVGIFEFRGGSSLTEFPNTSGKPLFLRISSLRVGGGAKGGFGCLYRPSSHLVAACSGWFFIDTAFIRSSDVIGRGLRAISHPPRVGGGLESAGVLRRRVFGWISGHHLPPTPPPTHPHVFP